MNHPEDQTPHELAPGQTCFGCGRRVPYPKKETSPDTRSITLRVPADEAESFEEIFEAAAIHFDAHSKPHWRYRTVLGSLILMLQSRGIMEYEGKS